MTDHKRPLEQAVDLAVYAPLGFVLEARKLLPSFIDRGRAQVQMTKVIGKFAVSQGQVTAGKGLAKVQKQAGSVLGELGLRPNDATAASSAPASSASADAPAGASAGASNGAVAGGRSGSGSTSGSVAQSGAGADDLAIPGYDSLAASQVIPRLAGLTAEELAAVARYESAHRARKTILGKISQIQAG